MAEPTDLLSAAVRLGERLRAAGLVVGVDAVVTFARSLDAAGAEQAYWCGRATLVRRPEDVPVFDAVFAGSPLAGAAPLPPQALTLELDAEGDDAPEGEEDRSEGGPTLTMRWSAQEVLREKDFAECDGAERDELARLIAALRVPLARRPSRRPRPSRAPGRTDLRRTLRRAMRTGGDPLERAWSEPGERARRLVVLLDVSGSMEPYARELLRFAHAAMVGRRSVEVFALGTRLTRLTRALTNRDPDAALRRATAEAADYAGGTRLGEGVRLFNDRWGVRGLARGAVVVILSDGWDRGDPEVLGAEVARLRRVAERVVWVNPLKATPGYQPLARGMAAALPHVDRFVEGHSVRSLEHLAEVIGA